MSNIKLQHPKGPASFSHEGQSFDSDEDGIIEIPSHFADQAKAHGFAEIEEEAPKSLKKPAQATTLKK